MVQHGCPTLCTTQINKVDDERKELLSALGPFGMPFAPRMEEIAPTSVTDSSLGPKVNHKQIDHHARNNSRHTYPNIRPIFRMKVLVANVVLSARHDPYIPEFRDLRQERAGILIERMER